MDAWANIGYYYMKLGQYEESLNASNSAIEINPNFAGIWYNKGFALKNLGRDDEALEAFEKANELDSTFEIPVFP